MRNTGLAACKEVDLLPIKLHTMGMLDVIPGPAKVLGILTGAAAEFL